MTCHIHVSVSNSVCHKKMKRRWKRKSSITDTVFILQAFCMAAIPAAPAESISSCCHWLCNTTPEPRAPLWRGSALYWNTQLPHLHLILTPQSPAFSSPAYNQPRLDSFHLTPDTSTKPPHTSLLVKCNIPIFPYLILEKILLMFHLRD